jgi:hypothetical protein
MSIVMLDSLSCSFTSIPFLTKYKSIHMIGFYFTEMRYICIFIWKKNHVISTYSCTVFTHQLWHVPYDIQQFRIKHIILKKNILDKIAQITAKSSKIKWTSQYTINYIQQQKL